MLAAFRATLCLSMEGKQQSQLICAQRSAGAGLEKQTALCTTASNHIDVYPSVAALDGACLLDMPQAHREFLAVHLGGYRRQA